MCQFWDQVKRRDDENDDISNCFNTFRDSLYKSEVRGHMDMVHLHAVEITEDVLDFFDFMKNAYNLWPGQLFLWMIKNQWICRAYNSSPIRSTKFE